MLSVSFLSSSIVQIAMSSVLAVTTVTEQSISNNVASPSISIVDTRVAVGLSPEVSCFRSFQHVTK